MTSAVYQDVRGERRVAWKRLHSSFIVSTANSLSSDVTRSRPCGGVSLINKVQPLELTSLRVNSLGDELSNHRGVRCEWSVLLLIVVTKGAPSALTCNQQLQHELCQMLSTLWQVGDD